METSILIIIFFSLNSILYSQGMYGVTSGDGSTVIACGKNGNVLKSVDAGRNWSSSVLAASNLKSLCSINNKYWIAGDNRSCYYSSDNGTTWNTVSIPTGSNYNSIFFTDALTGWIAGDNGTILRSVDGGYNWVQQTSGTLQKLNSIKFLNSNTGVACGMQGVVLKTTNGGSNWQNFSVPTTRELLDIDIKGTSICATGEYASFFTISLSGSAWTIVDQRFKTMSDINGICMLNENTLFTCGGGGFIRKSIDGGDTYTYPQNPMFGELYRIFFYDQLTGWAISRKSYAVLRTTDGGATWLLPEGASTTYNWYRTLQYGYNQTFGDAINTFNHLNKKVIYTLAANKLYRSPDIGETWTHISTLPYAALFSQYLQVSQRDTSKMIALLQNPTRIYYTSNYGTNWLLTSSVAAGQTGIPIASHPANPDTLYFGSVNSLYRSTNFGLNWSLISLLPISYGVCDIEINYVNPNEMLISTKSPVRILRSTNGGLNFIQTNSDPAIYGESPAMCSNIYEPQTAYHLFYNTLGNDGIFKSTNFGLNWNKISSLTYLWSIAIAPDDPNIIIAGGWDATPRPGYISTNNGNSFIETSLLLGEYNGNEAIYIYDKGNILFQQTIGIYKLNVTYFVPAIGIQNISGEIPNKFTLEQNYPNPFNPVTKIRFQIPAFVETIRRVVSLKIYDVLGKEISTLVNEELKPGTYEIEWNAANYPSGVYFYSLITNNFTQTRKLVLVK